MTTDTPVAVEWPVVGGEYKSRQSEVRIRIISEAKPSPMGKRRVSVQRFIGDKEAGPVDDLYVSTIHANYYHDLPPDCELSRWRALGAAIDQYGITTVTQYELDSLLGKLEAK